MYYEDTYLKEFDGKVLKILKTDDRHGAILDRTAFYPTGGGQVKTMKREEANRYVESFHESLKTLLPKVQEVQIVEIKDWHACACGGTHLKSTGEIETVKVLKRVSKGKGVERIEFSAKES